MISFLRLRIYILLFYCFGQSIVSYASITKGPYLNQPEQSSMTIMWESDLSENTVVYYGEDTNLNSTMDVMPFDNKNKFYLYRAKIAELQSGRKYFYKIVMSDTASKLLYFHTNPSFDSSIEFVAIGDSRSGHEILRNISGQINTLEPDFIINIGDLVLHGEVFDEWSPHYFEPLSKLIDHIPLISTLGDHDKSRNENDYFRYYLFPDLNKDQMWFSYDYGLAHFVSLDYRRENDSLMIKWFEDDMKRSKAKWKFVYLHRPTYNVGGHRYNWGATHWPKLYRKYNVDIVFSGHSHIYERFFPMRPTNEPEAWPVTYITTGGAGAGLYDSVVHNHIAKTQSVNHFITIKLTEDSLQLTALLPDMSVLDQVEIIKKDGKYDDSYLGLVKPQEELDIHMVFGKTLFRRFNQIPTKNIPATSEIHFRSRGLDEDIHFDVQLSEESRKGYRIEPLTGVLEKDKEFKGTIKVYAKDSVSIDDPFFIPPLFLDVHYKTMFVSGVTHGRECRYIP
jgi:predicted phosphodiesterase